MIRAVKLPAPLQAACIAEAARMYPLETGGLFLGRHGADGVVEIEYLIGPGPNAIHRRGSLEVDHLWQNERIAEIYVQSGRNVSWVGEWHSHPDARSGNMSGIDKATLLQLATFEALRALNPVMGIFYGKQSNWKYCFWKIAAVRRVFRSWCSVDVAELPAR